MSESRGKKGSVFRENPFANRKRSVLASVLKLKLKREGGLKDGLESTDPAREFLAAEPAAAGHGKPQGAGNALTFHNWSDDD